MKKLISLFIAFATVLSCIAAFASCSDNGEGDKALTHLIFSDIFGGGTYSKLFKNVREKQSLCYYCSASGVFKKGYMLVDSGIDAQNADRVIEAVGKELNDIKNGNIDDCEIESSKKAVCETLMSYYDSASSLDLWYAKSIDIDLWSPKEMAEKIKSITKEQIVNAANCYKLHTIYKLLPEGSNLK
ncbi:MAG: insulinase family protein [Clostridia bacterium]|nr:insulinase family protein [Clostridia bacterium]